MGLFEIDRGLLKGDKNLGWTPLLYLVYVLFIFVEPALGHGSARVWLLTIGGLIAFLFCYFGMFCKWPPGPLWYASGTAALGFLSLPFNGGTSCYFIYAGSALGFLVESGLATRLLFSLVIAETIEMVALHTGPWYILITVLMTSAIGLTNIHYGSQRRANSKLKLAQDELEQLTKVAERERIARDLHDVLGHTLSVIIIKSELASKLIDRDISRARDEITQVERIARDALNEVRQTIRGYNAATLPEEFARAKATLETAGVSTECNLNEPTPHLKNLSPAQEAVLALIVREAVTNVVRHARASKCRIFLEQLSSGSRLCVEDNGRGGKFHEGNGLRGMRERIEALGGAMTYDTSRGTRLEILIPKRLPQEAIA